VGRVGIYPPVYGSCIIHHGFCFFVELMLVCKIMITNVLFNEYAVVQPNDSLIRYRQPAKSQYRIGYQWIIVAAYSVVLKYEYLKLFTYTTTWHMKTPIVVIQVLAPIYNSFSFDNGGKVKIQVFQHKYSVLNLPIAPAT